MSIRKTCAMVAFSALVGLGSQHKASAQFVYPGGYGGYGWGGWGGQTAYGDIARGMGVYAAGAGVYNLKTAEATSINADTVTRWNQYWYEAQVNANRNQRARMARRQEATVKSVAQLESRLKEQPTERDILQGDALNYAVEEINDPRIYSKALQSAKVKVGGEVIRSIPFQYAAQAISTSVHDLTEKGAPPILRKPEFAAQRAEIKELATVIRAAADEGEPIDQGKLKEIQDKLLSLRETFEKTVKRTEPGFAEGDRFLKAAYGLARMLETPAVDVLLAGIEDRPDATLTELLGFMSAFNLRFGPAESPEQQRAYKMLWPLVDKVRDEAVAVLEGSSATARGDSSSAAADFFSGMDHEEMRKKPAPQPPAPK